MVLDKLKKASEKTKTDLDDIFIKILREVKPSFYVFISLYISLQFLSMPNIVDPIIKGLFILVIVFQIVRALQTFIDYGME